MGADSGHDQVGRQVENDIADVKQRQTSRDLLGCYVQDGAEVMLLLQVHCLSKSHIGANGRAQKIQNPEGWQNSSIQLAVYCQNLEQNIRTKTHLYTFSIFSISSTSVSTCMLCSKSLCLGVLSSPTCASERLRGTGSEAMITGMAEAQLKTCNHEKTVEEPDLICICATLID